MFDDWRKIPYHAVNESLKEKAMRTIRWGIIGCGDVTEVKSGPAFQKIPGSSLVAVMRRDGKKAADYAKRHQVPRWYDDAIALINDPEVDAIYIATPPYAHLEYTLLAAQAGKPIYCEKPLGLSYEHSKKMVEACQKHDVPLFAAFYRRALPKFLLVKKLIEENAIGTVRSVSVLMCQAPKKENLDGSAWRIKPELAGGGLFHDVGCHVLDLLDWLFGPIIEAHGRSGRQETDYDAPDIVSGSWIFENGVHGSGMWSFNAWDDFDSVTVVGSKGTLTFSVMDLAAPLDLQTLDGSRTIGVPEPPEHVAQPLIQTVMDQLLGKGTCPSTGESGLRTDWVMSRIAN
jgi:predicted dehydrogenase